MTGSTRRGFLQSTALGAGLAGRLWAGVHAPANGQGVDVSVFTADVTPPVGEPLNCGYNAPVQTIEHPLLAKGLVIGAGPEACVLCAIDWVGLCHEAHDLFRTRIARAVGTTPARVAVQTVHQHTAPAVDTRAQRFLEQTPGAPATAGLDFLETAAERVAQAASASLSQPRRVTGVSGGWAAVDRVASSRRIRQPDGTILTRFSRATDPELQTAPEGHIDAFVRTVTLHEADRPVACLHYYATHPQSYYGDGRVTYDVPGIARERLQQETGVFQVYFNGCGGDITMGKYNDGTPGARAALADRLCDGMRRALAQERWRAPVDGCTWSAQELRFPARSSPEFGEVENRRVLESTGAGSYDRIKAAMVLGFIERARSGPPFDITCLGIGPARIVHLPGEPFVDFQLWAQRTYREAFVCVAGYGDCAMWYYGPDAIYTDVGGFEQTWSFVDPSESLVRGVMAAVLNPEAHRS
jgi:hypothetical protein